MEGSNHDGDATPTPVRRAASVEAELLADVALGYNGLAVHVGEASRLVDRLDGPERAAYLEALALRVGELAEQLHEFRRLTREI